jgi:hypothetical protein
LPHDSQVVCHSKRIAEFEYHRRHRNLNYSCFVCDLYSFSDSPSARREAAEAEAKAEEQEEQAATAEDSDVIMGDEGAHLKRSFDNINDHDIPPQILSLTQEQNEDVDVGTTLLLMAGQQEVWDESFYVEFETVDIVASQQNNELDAQYESIDSAAQDDDDEQATNGHTGWKFDDAMSDDDL